MKKLYLLPIILIMITSCSSALNNDLKNNGTHNSSIENCIIKPGAENMHLYLHLLSDKKVGLVTNQTGVVQNTHLVDTLLSYEIKLIKIFCPEHGFRGTADAGEKVDDNIDNTTGLPIISLYGNNRKPTKQQMQDLDIMVFDLQDVGVRFYTYISTLHYVMEACAENNIPLIVLDRPNPNAHYVDGPVLNPKKINSFIGMHPVPVVYGMTIGEYAKMINGEKWLDNGVKCDLKVIPIKNYSHNTPYSLPINPSPNLPNDRSIELYPTLCYFEGTVISIGRGTNKQFQIIGHPKFKDVEQATYTFTPKPNIGAQNPKLLNELCYGFDLSSDNSIFDIDRYKLNISVIIKAYNLFPDKENFFIKNNFFDLLSGNTEFKKQILNNISEKEIRESWEPELSEFKKIRERYLIY